MLIQHHKTKIRINDRYNASDRVSIARDIIRLIKDRTNNGVGVSGVKNSEGTYSATKKFKGYTKEYVQSKKFTNAGKSQSQVNLQLSKRMMGNLKLLNHDIGFIEIGYQKGSKDNAKAEGNIIGSYGGAPNKSNARNFLGITEQELSTVLLRHPIPGDLRFAALALAGILFLKEENESKEFFIDLDLENLKGQ